MPDIRDEMSKDVVDGDHMYIFSPKKFQNMKIMLNAMWTEMKMGGVFPILVLKILVS